MKQILLAGCLFLFILNSSGQTYQVFKGDTINHKDKKGLKQGLWRKYYMTDTLCSETHFIDDKPSGISRTWYESGKLKGEVKFEKKNSLNNATTYFENGKIMALGFYKGQLKDSTWTYYQESTDTISTVEQYKNGVPYGSWKTFYKNGQLAHELNYVAGKKDGKVKEFSEDGKLIFEIQYKSGLEEGLSVLYYPDGRIREKGMYKKGERDGTWQQFETDGKLIKETKYKNGFEVK